MNRRIRSRSATADGYLRYLKPGALAQLRDSKIIAKTHHRSSTSQIYLHRATSLSPVASPSRSPNSAGAGQQHQEEATGTVVAAADGGSPCFSVRFYGPRCPQRKKLMAARSIFFMDPSLNSSTSDGPEPVIDAFPNDFLVAH